jgi:vacuolar-type H+-ATPase subunit H
MKKAARLILKVLSGLILLILLLLFTVPVIFKDKIRTSVEKIIEGSVNANVKFEDYSLSFFRNFPNLAFSMKNLSVTGKGQFEGDTLAGFNSFNLVFNFSSIFKKSGYEVKSIIMDKAVVNAIVLKDGKANWDIMTDTSEVETESTASTSDMKILLRNVEMLNSRISYQDYESDMQAYLKDVNFNLQGDMTASTTDLRMAFTADDFRFVMEGVNYLNKAKIDSKIDMLANIDSMKFSFRENYLSINDLKLNFTGDVEMPGDDIATDLKFTTPVTSFKTLLSLIPSFYMNDYQDLKASGDFNVAGAIKGIYSDADSTIPDVDLKMSVANGLISYPDLPEKIENININASVFVDGKDMDRTTVDVSKFHLELAKNPFDITFSLKTPMSDPDFRGSMNGTINLKALSEAIPMDSLDLSGIITASLYLEGKMSMIEKERYQDFTAKGNMKISDMAIAMAGYPEVNISNALFDFTPAYAAMSDANLKVGGKSDFSLSGRLENYIPYVFSNQTIKGNLSMRSKVVDASDIMNKMASDTTAEADTSSLSVIRVPRNINFDFDALIDDFSYENIKARNVKGHMIVNDGVISIRDAGMNILDGTVNMNADYDTRDSLKPSVKASFKVNNISVKNTFATFNTVQKLAPAAKGIDGKISGALDYSSLLGMDMMPVIKSINGSGKIQSDQLTLLESKTFNKVKDALKLGDKFSNTFRDVNISFKMADGRVYVSPFDIKTGNLKMNISGDQGLDQTINYIVKTEIPRSDLGGSVNSLIESLSAQAASYGVNYRPSDVIKVSLKVGGTFTDPKVSPFFGSSTADNQGGVKETVKETVKQTVTNAVDDGKAKARAEAEAQGARLVKEAEEKASQIKEEAATAAAKIRDEAAAQSKKLVDEASSKGAIAKMAAQKSADAINKTADTKATQLVNEANTRADKLVEEANTRSRELIEKI